jgi:DNA-binding LacI/PurR family transcriptional regulator
MSQATLKDIARQLNLSISTISKALHNHPDIKDKTKRKVQQLAQKLDYFPDPIAQSLQRKKTKTIGVIVPQIRHEFFSTIISGIEDIAYRVGYTIMFCQSNESYEREIINTHSLVSHRVAGILVSVSQTTKKSDHFVNVVAAGIPVAFFDREINNLKASKVLSDDYMGAFQAVEYLIKSGYRHIAHLAGFRHLTIAIRRLQGYKDALKKHLIEYNEDLVIYGGLSESDGVEGIKKILKLSSKPEAVFAVNDPVAIGVYKVLKARHLKIPGDMAVVGFSDNSICSLIEPPLTTVYQQPYLMGQKAAEILIDQIENDSKTINFQEEILETRLIIRGST